jgi:hypothetical protein
MYGKWQKELNKQLKVQKEQVNTSNKISLQGLKLAVK